MLNLSILLRRILLFYFQVIQKRFLRLCQTWQIIQDILTPYPSLCPLLLLDLFLKYLKLLWVHHLLLLQIPLIQADNTTQTHLLHCIYPFIIIRKLIIQIGKIVLQRLQNCHSSRDDKPIIIHVTVSPDSLWPPETEPFFHFTMVSFLR